MSWTIDSAHTSVTFHVRHMMISNVHGRFEKVDGMVNFDEDNPAHSQVDVTIDATSISTREGQRDAHLKSPDFLDVAQFPTITFKSKRIEPVGENAGRIIGDLTIKDVTREVVLETHYAGQARSPWGAISAGFTASAQISRKDWGLTWNVALETGGWLVGDTIHIAIEVEIVRQAAPQEDMVMA